jgi:hypothetical protein
MGNKAYRVRNWKEYNNALIKRGSITVWIDEKSIHQWYERKKRHQKRGHPKVYSDVAIQTALIIKQVYRLTLRSCQGFIESLVELLKLEVEAPSYSQLCRRQGTIKLPQLPKSRESVHLVIDSSGLKIFGEGEWKVRRYGWSKRRTWRKLHIGVDEKRGLIVSAVLTENGIADDKILPELLNSYKGSINQVSGDGAYDSHDCFNAIVSLGAKATIPPQPNPKHKRKNREDIKRARDEVVWQIQQFGRESWKEQSGYHRRSLVEAMFYRYKQLFGSQLLSRKLVNQRTEALLRCCALNKMTLLGMPDSVEITN